MTTNGNAQATATTWMIDADHTHVGFAVRHMMLATVKGRFAGVTGEVELDGDDVASGAVRVEIDVATIDTRNEQRDAHLRSADFFDVANHPVLTFRSVRVDRRGGADSTSPASSPSGESPGRWSSRRRRRAGAWIRGAMSGSGSPERWRSGGASSGSRGTRRWRRAACWSATRSGSPWTCRSSGRRRLRRGMAGLDRRLRRGDSTARWMRVGSRCHAAAPDPLGTCNGIAASGP
jgi:hypothetical protein